ncbi:hypothetical protein RT723_06560 [Psychrosphaera aquimarina]|uniref:Uncharacterized protein n=1 Tax=Psychrosphaera aquimarina TaxID=2044854 RepID=A0ABU3QZT9_9GAMM|nr:hypothetical protein [Psychrosphaera aquimarina]MDU0112670.1 hypothetical protein [Psychrosphaera aquimarina]
MKLDQSGLFGGSRLIWVKNAANDKKLVSALSGVLEEIGDSVSLIIEAGDLEKRPLHCVKLSKKPRPAVAIPCYADDGRALQNLIDQELDPTRICGWT